MPRSPYGAAAYEVLQQKLLGSVIFHLLFVAGLLLLFQLSPSRLLRLDVFSGLSWAWIGASLVVFLQTCPVFVLKLVSKSPERTVLSRRLAASLLLHVAVFAASASYVFRSYIRLVDPVRATKAWYYPDGAQLPARLSERYFFVALSAGWVGLCYAVFFVLADRNRVAFPAIQRLGGKLPGISLKATLVQCGRAVLGYQAAFWLLYAVFGGLLFSAYGSASDWILWLFVDLRYEPSSWDTLLDVRLLAELVAAGTLAAACWEVADSLYDGCMSEAIPASDGTRDPIGLLTTGLVEKDQSYRYVAFLELGRVVRFSAPGRADIFADVDSDPTKWSRILKECVFVIQELAVAAEERLSSGKPKEPASDKPQAKVTRLPTFRAGNLSDSITPLRNIQLRPLPTTPTQKPRNLLGAFTRALGSDGQTTPGPQRTATDPRSPIVQVPSILRPHGDKPAAADEVASPTTPVAGPAKDTAAGSLAAPSLFDRVRISPVGQAVLKSDLYRSFKAWEDRNASLAVAARSQLTIAAIRLICDLATFSYTEDNYGLVQRDMPLILESLLRCLVALERLQIETRPSPGPFLEKHERDIKTVVEALKTGLYQIATTFYENLRHFNLSPKVKEQLQGYVDMAR
ncbi:nucleoporin protein Ndc1-Nup [Hyaloraphidium curvatum]|nr:nucleoporin protein Ndc1-Nup [Hyaloraphidium curvatum]